MAPPLRLSVAALLLRMGAAQAPWSGDMHPQVPMKADCNMSAGDDCAPTYSDLAAANALWACPAGNATPATCGAGGNCAIGTGANPLCNGLNAASPCCCPAPGCATTPNFNWIVGVCKGAGCACGKSSAPSCAPQNRSDQCGSDCTGAVVPCCFGQDVSALQRYYDEGTHALINYVAAYQFNASDGKWHLQPESSFNTDGRFPAFDMMQRYGGLPPAQAWLAPQPGGSVFWSEGYYPAGVTGVGPPGAMFVLSTEDWFAGTFYMLNQLSLDRGPGAINTACGPGQQDNCWAAGNAGEMDFLEPAWNSPAAAAFNYTQSFATQNNQVGRCFTGSAYGGGFGSNHFVTTEPSPIDGGKATPVVYVAVVDSVGTWLYCIPGERVASIWPGLNRTWADAVVQAAPDQLVDSVNPGTTDFALSFTPNCQAKTYADAQAQQCEFNGQQGFCGNVFAQMANTGQPLWPSADCPRDVRGGVAMPWCKAMVAPSAGATGNATLPGSCAARRRPLPPALGGWAAAMGSVDAATARR